MLKAMKFVFLCILRNENYCLKAKLIETKFIHRVIYTCIEFSIKISDKKAIFSLLFSQPILISQAQVTFFSTDRGKHRKKGLQTSLILISDVTRVTVFHFSQRAFVYFVLRARAFRECVRVCIVFCMAWLNHSTY